MAKKASTYNGKVFTMPKGTFVHCYLNTPDDYEGSVKFKCKLSVPQEEAEAFMAIVDEFADEAADALDKKSLAKRPWDDDEMTEGNILFKTSCNGQYPPKLFDASGTKEHSRTIPVMGGSVGRLRVKLVGYSGFGGGVSLRLTAAQILELKEANSGFDAEDGYVAPDVDEDVPNIQDEQEAPFDTDDGEQDATDF